jgi:hypothetical protein
MTIAELCNEINFQCETSKPYSKNDLIELEYHYYKMFKKYCNAIVNFEIINTLGQIQLKGFVL